jgi:hypothetical protein
MVKSLLTLRDSARYRISKIESSIISSSLMVMRKLICYRMDYSKTSYRSSKLITLTTWNVQLCISMNLSKNSRIVKQGPLTSAITLFCKISHSTSRMTFILHLSNTQSSLIKSLRMRIWWLKSYLDCIPLNQTRIKRAIKDIDIRYSQCW